MDDNGRNQGWSATLTFPANRPCTPPDQEKGPGNSRVLQFKTHSIHAYPAAAVQSPSSPESRSRFSRYLAVSSRMRRFRTVPVDPPPTVRTAFSTLAKPA